MTAADTRYPSSIRVWRGHWKLLLKAVGRRPDLMATAQPVYSYVTSSLV